MERNNINLAKAYLGYKGGYTLQQLKRIFKAEKKDKERKRLLRQAERDMKNASQHDEEEGAELDNEELKEGETEEGKAGDPLSDQLKAVKALK